MADLLLEAMEARNRGETAQSRQLLAQALVQDPHNEGAWMLMSEVVDEARLKRNCLQRVLMINPHNEAASIALMKLDTSPLGPVVRGERYKPVIPPKLDPTPPFTPPFTWTGDDGLPDAEGNMVYPDLTGELVNQPPSAPVSFDWAAESSEPDKTIDKIFDRISNPDKAFQPLPDTDLEALARDESMYAGLSQEEKESRMLDDVVGASVAAATQQNTPSTEQNTPSAEQDTPSTEPKPAVAASAGEPGPLLWHNPKAKTGRLVILGISSIIYANPAEGDIPHILGLFEEKKMMRDLLGQEAATIKFESIQKLIANPQKSTLDIYFKPGEKTIEHKLAFESTQARNEALSAVEHRLGTAFAHRMQTTTLKDKLLFPLLGILVVAILEWFFLAGLPRLSQLAAFQSGMLYIILYNIQYYIDLIGPVYVLMIGVVLALLCLVWMVINLSKPAELIIIERKPGVSI